MSIALEIIDQQSRLERERTTWDSHWSEIAEVILPRQDDFFQNNERTPGEKRTQKKFDDTGALALDKFSAAMESILTPRASRWHGLKSGDPVVDDNQEAEEWFDRVTDFLFSIRYSPRSNYASQQHEVYMSLGAFGTGVMIVEDTMRGIRYKSSHLSEHYFMENIHGRVDIDYRKYRLTARQAAEKFGAENLPEKIQTALEKEPHTKFWFIHLVMPNTGDVSKDFAFASYHVSIEGKKLLGTGGFKTFPFIISRYVTAPSEIYGRSPGMTALAEIKMLNAMRKSDLRARHMAIDPPILATSEATLRRLKMQPAHINPGTLDANGNPLVKPYMNGARIELSNDAIMQSREFINDTFLVTLFQILVDQPQMTATEVLQRAQEKGSLLSPTMGRQQSEALGPMIEREMSILEGYGLFEDGAILEMPDVVKQLGGEYQVEYTSPLSRMQKTEEALGTQRTLEAALPLVQLDPSILDNFDLDQYVDIMGDSNGAPARLFRAPEERDAIRKARAEAAQMAALAEAAPTVAGAVKDIAQAQSYSNA